MPPFKILIIGSGAAGLASAIAITKALPAAELTIFELRNEPGTIGGAVNLTPNALRCLDILGVLEQLKRRRSGCDVNSIQLFSLHTGASMGTIDYRGSKYRAMRVMRSELLQAMLHVAEKLKLQIKYGKKLTGIEETPESVKAIFEDGIEHGDLVLGCDGIHSATRMQIDPDRAPEYSGISTAYGFTKSEEKMFFEETGLAMSRAGALLATYCDAEKQQIYVAALTESKMELSKEGWRALGEDQEAVRQNILERFQDSALPNIKELVHSVENWFLYPVYLLPPEGKWCTERVMLLGDAAHAMPPKGENIGYALDDAVIFARYLSHFGLGNLAETFLFYQGIRRVKIYDAYKTAAMGWNTNKDKGFLFTKVMEWLTPLYLWWTRGSREASYAADPCDIQFPDPK